MGKSPREMGQAQVTNSIHSYYSEMVTTFSCQKYNHKNVNIVRLRAEKGAQERLLSYRKKTFKRIVIIFSG